MIIILLSLSVFFRAWTQEQLMFLADNTQAVQDRDRTVQHILQSTIQLNQLFRDVAQLVTDQVTDFFFLPLFLLNAIVKVFIKNASYV